MKHKKSFCMAGLAILAVYYAYDAFYCNGNLLFPYKLASVSPNGIYKIEIKEAAKSSDEYGISSEDYKVILRWEKNGITQLSYCDNAIIGWSSTGEDDGSKKHASPFAVRHPHADWITENIIRFGTKATGILDKNTRYVHNQTDQIINYLWVGWYGGRYVIIDLQPGAKVMLPLGGSFEGALCAGRFSNKAVIACPGHPLGALPPYCLIIKPDRIVFGCQQNR